MERLNTGDRKWAAKVFHCQKTFSSARKTHSFDQAVWSINKRELFDKIDPAKPEQGFIGFRLPKKKIIFSKGVRQTP